ncbi:MAG: rhamnulokinase [Phycisphaerales bacterium]
MSKRAYLAFDLGAGSGRAMLGVLADGKLSLHELHRFENNMHLLPDGYHWDTLGLWANLKRGLAAAGKYCGENGLELTSLGVDTWGVDFGLIGRSGSLIGLPWAYRDPRNEGAMAKVIERIGAEKLYAATGIQFMPFNTLFQLSAFLESEPTVLRQARKLLFMPDLLHYFFTGNTTCEATIASTSQMIDPKSGKWANELLDELDIPRRMLGKIVQPGGVIGMLRAEVAEECGVSANIRVIAPASHDTASAVAAVPADPVTKWVYLSSGTWSLMGAELKEPILSDSARKANFTNEGGVNKTIRFLKNITGMWLIQELKRAFDKQGSTADYAKLTELAGKAEAFRTLVDPSFGPFMQPGDMPGKIAEFAGKTGQPAPQSEGQFVRCCLESLALTYRMTLEGLEKVLGQRFDVIHIVGGGGKNELLNRMTADATGRTVVVGPYEATAAGNLLVQAMGAGDVKDLAQLRQVVAASFGVKKFAPGDGAAWDGAYKRYLGLIGK